MPSQWSNSPFEREIATLFTKVSLDIVMDTRSFLGPVGLVSVFGDIAKFE